MVMIPEVGWGAGRIFQPKRGSALGSIAMRMPVLPFGEFIHKTPEGAVRLGRSVSY